MASVEDVEMATPTPTLSISTLDEPMNKRASSANELAFDGSQLSFIEECTEEMEMEYEFTESRDSLTDLPSSHTYRKEPPLKVRF